jgi:hypothetical protein
MGRQTFDGERAGDADFLFVVVRLVVEKFKLGFGGDGLVHFRLPVNPRFPPIGVRLFRGVRPFGICLAGDFPFRP